MEHNRIITDFLAQPANCYVIRSFASPAPSTELYTSGNFQGNLHVLESFECEQSIFWRAPHAKKGHNTFGERAGSLALKSIKLRFFRPRKLPQRLISRARPKTVSVSDTFGPTSAQSPPPQKRPGKGRLTTFARTQLKAGEGRFKKRRSGSGLRHHCFNLIHYQVPLPLISPRGLFAELSREKHWVSQEYLAKGSSNKLTHSRF